MAPLPENNTDRVWLQYTSLNVVHEVMFRLPAGIATPATAQAKAQALAAVLASRMRSSDSTIGARYSPAGTNFSVPLGHTPVVGTGGTSSWTQDPESVQLSITGRSYTDGRDVTYQIFSPLSLTAWPSDNRFNPGESAPMDTFRLNFQTWVNTAGSPGEQVVTISNTIPSLNPYVNIRSNAYWQNQQR